MKDLSVFLTEKLNMKRLKSPLGNPWYTVTKDNIKVQMVRFDEPSQYGINKGRISKLWMKDLNTGKVVYDYDRGETNFADNKNLPSNVKKLLDEIIKEWN